MLQIAVEQDEYVPNTSRVFLAGLLDWSGDERPTGEAIAGAGLLDQGKAHVKTVTATGGAILGHRPLEDDQLRPFTWVTHRGGGTVHLYEGLSRLRAASDDERDSMPAMATWGHTFIQALANRRLADH
ncbi:hypothetical protein DFJ67_1367 [Asanoa ferruginea]|uniref:Uncharacterized protein n=1 Tax=Asanoa ferruginea TaxID=53367 RepID=A0A3D9ZP48_9ACTN|nr:hypothetical protein DFJ67_1367 [Asanoa ferruginea]GIF46678.1 hypothetical protein Afe04nite_12170 [Asanoa ferruginea]